MGRVRCGLAVVLAFALQRGLLVHLPLLGVMPPLFPGVIALLGVTQGRDRGAECGFFGGVLALLAGASPWYLALYPLMGGISGAVFHNSGGSWGNCLRAIPVLTGAEGLLLLGHWLAGEGWAWAVALPELALSLACVPLGAFLLWLVGRGRPGVRANALGLYDE